MSDLSLYEETKLLARLTVLEHVVGMMVREAMLRTGKGPQDILHYGEAVKAFFKGRTPEGANDHDLDDAADKFFRPLLRISEARTGSSDRRQIRNVPMGDTRWNGLRSAAFTLMVGVADPI